MQISTPQGVARIFGSSKAICAIAASSIAAWMVSRGMGTENVALVTGPLWAYVFGQSLADIGKGKAQVQQQVSKPPEDSSY